VRVDHDPAFRARLLELTGRWTVPQVLVDGQPIGGFLELRELDRRGLLTELDERAAGSAG
jgi:glutaredoxin 3